MDMDCYLIYFVVLIHWSTTLLLSYTCIHTLMSQDLAAHATLARHPQYTTRLGIIPRLLRCQPALALPQPSLPQSSRYPKQHRPVRPSTQSRSSYSPARLRLEDLRRESLVHTYMTTSRSDNARLLRLGRVSTAAFCIEAAGSRGQQSAELLMSNSEPSTRVLSLSFLRLRACFYVTRQHF